MPDVVEVLVRDLLSWVGPTGRPYREVIEAWRTSCPRLPVWEEANDRGFLVRSHIDGRAIVAVTPAGTEFLKLAQH